MQRKWNTLLTSIFFMELSSPMFSSRTPVTLFFSCLLNHSSSPPLPSFFSTHQLAPPTTHTILSLGVGFFPFLCSLPVLYTACHAFCSHQFPARPPLRAPDPSLLIYVFMAPIRCPRVHHRILYVTQPSVCPNLVGNISTFPISQAQNLRLPFCWPSPLHPMDHKSCQFKNISRIWLLLILT